MGFKRLSIKTTLLSVLLGTIGLFVLGAATPAHAADLQGSAWACSWKSPAHIHCETGSSLTAIANRISDISNLDVVNSRTSAGYWTRSFRHEINSDVIGSFTAHACIAGKHCGEFWYDPNSSLANGYPVFRQSSNNYLQFPDLSEPGAGKLTSTSAKITKEKVLTSDGYRPSPVVNLEEALNSKDPGICSISNSTSCKIDDHAGGGTMGPGNKAQFDAFLSPFHDAINQNIQMESCDKDAGALGFILCPVMDAVVTAERTVLGWISDLLVFNTGPLQTTAMTQAYQKVLNVANALYVLIFLIIIFANSLSISLDAYTVKKAMPKLIASILITQFAYFFLGAFIELGNLLGKAIEAFFSAPVAIGLGKINPLVAGLSVFLIILLGIIGLIAALVGYVVIAVRKVILYILVLAAPIAIAANILPGTQKGFKFWLDNFIKIVMMYPIIAALLSGSVWVSTVILSTGASTVEQVTAMLLPMIALLYLPKTLKWSGKLMASTGGAIAGFGAGKAKGAYQKSAKEGSIAKTKGAAYMGAGQGLTHVPVLGNKLGGSAMKKGAGLKGAAAKAEKDFFGGFGKDDLETYLTSTGGKGKMGKAAMGEYDKRRADVAKEQADFVRHNPGVPPDPALAEKITKMAEFKYNLGGTTTINPATGEATSTNGQVRDGTYYDPRTGLRSGSIKASDIDGSTLKKEVVSGVVKGLRKDIPGPAGTVTEVVVRSDGLTPGSPPAHTNNPFPNFKA